MGAKQSKKTGARKFLLNDKREIFVNDFAVADLERSTAEDRVHNSFGLPSDVLAWLVGRYLEPGDLGRLSLTCKTWRRIVLQDVVWRTMATRINVQLEEGTDPRASVLDCIRKVKPDFCWLPPKAEAIQRAEAGDRERTAGCPVFTITLLSPSEADDTLGCGKSALVLKFACNYYVDDYGDPIVLLMRKLILTVVRRSND
jgi:hypothetical protein